MTATSSDRPAASRLYALDGLRLLCALAVAGYHFGDSWRLDGIHRPIHHLPEAAPVLIYGFLGVESFFLISGFVILMSGWGQTLRGFAASRVARLYPAFWACVLITTAVSALLPIEGGLPFGDLPDSADVLVNLTMLAEPLNTPMVDTVYWTLWCELRFYLIIAFLVAAGLTDRRVKVFATGWLLAAIALPYFPDHKLGQMVMPDFAPYFIAGMTMFLLRRQPRDLWSWILLAACWLLSQERVHTRALSLDPGFPVPTWPAHVMISVVFWLLLVIALGGTDRLRSGWLATAGALTYPFYLLHQRAGYSLIRTVAVETGADAAFIIAGAVLVLLVASWAVHRLVERPLAPRLKKILNGRVAAAPGPNMSRI